MVITYYEPRNIHRQISSNASFTFVNNKFFFHLNILSGGPCVAYDYVLMQVSILFLFSVFGRYYFLYFVLRSYVLYLRSLCTLCKFLLLLFLKDHFVLCLAVLMRGCGNQITLKGNGTILLRQTKMKIMRNL